MEIMIQRLKEIGINVDNVVSRLGGNEIFYLSVCRRFQDDRNYQLFQNALVKDDFESARIYIHTLKGVSANLGFAQMELICKSILEDLKNNDIVSLQQHKAELSEDYNKIVSILI